MPIPWPTMRQNAQNTGLGVLRIPQGESPSASAFPTNGLIFSTPVIDENEIVYAGSADHYLYAYDPKQKKVLWKFETGEIIDSAAALHPNGTIIIPSGDGHIYCVDKNGKKIWAFDVTSNRTPDQFTLATSYWWEGNVAIGPDGNIYAGNDDFFLYSLTPEGTLRWKFRTGLFIWSAAAFDRSGVVYAASFDGYMYALNCEDGSLIWKTDVKNPMISSPVIYDDYLIECTLNGTMIVMNRHTGNVLWTTSIPTHAYATPLITPDGYIVTASSSGEIIMHDITTRKTLWTHKEESVVRASLVAGIDPEQKEAYLIYGGNAEGHVFALTPSGQQRYRLHTAPEEENPNKFVINASLALGNHGIALAAGKYIYYLPYKHYLDTNTDHAIQPEIQKELSRTDLAHANAYIFDTIHITSPTIIPTLDQIGLQSLRVYIGIIARDESNNTFLAHGMLMFGRNEEGELLGVPHAQTYSFAFHGNIYSDRIEFMTNNIYFETSGFPFPLDSLTIATIKAPADSNATIHAHVHKKGPFRTFFAAMRAYNATNPARNVFQNIKTIHEIPHMITAWLLLTSTGIKFIARKYWDGFDLFDKDGSIDCVGMASLRPLDHAPKSKWAISSRSYNTFFRRITVNLNASDRHALCDEVSIILADSTTLIPLPINYSKSVRHAKLSETTARISLSIPDGYATSDLTAYVVDKTTLLESFPLYPANPGK